MTPRKPSEVWKAQWQHKSKVGLEIACESSGHLLIKLVDINGLWKNNSRIRKTGGYGNAALINLMKAHGNIENDIDAVPDFYFNLCSIEMRCKELSLGFLYLANSGINPSNGGKILSLSMTKRINAIMQLCGFYDEAGEFAFRVGLPGKSGVGGGIIAIHPQQFCIAVWSPKLNRKGNSNKGMQALELFTTKTRSSIF